MDLEILITPGLGDNTFMVSSAGQAAVIDPQRDVGRLLRLAQDKDVAIRCILETHVHNDYVSGALELAAATGGEVGAPARGGYAFDHRPLAEGDRIEVGDARLLTIETPGHTPEHLAYLVYEGGADIPVAVFTGGSLMVGGAGRTDLMGPSLRDELTRAQYHTMRRLADLPGEVQVMPTHGAGSFCGAGPAPSARTSTLGQERLSNRALTVPDEETFVQQQLSGLLAYPAYYRMMASINRAGPRLVGTSQPGPAALTPDQVERLMDARVRVVDGRPRDEFAAAHIPGSTNVELDDRFASYVGWLIPFNERLVVVVPEPFDGQAGEAAIQLLRIGYERIEGYLRGGIEAWRQTNRPTSSYRAVDQEELCRSFRDGAVDLILDVRQPTEWDRGHIEGSQHLFVGDLPERIGLVPKGREVWTMCATGHRASIAASLLDAAGITVVDVMQGGVPRFLRDCLQDSAS